MINFEHWKLELTVEQMANQFGSAESCSGCPLDSVTECYLENRKCSDIIRDWANAPYKPQEVQP